MVLATIAITLSSLRLKAALHILAGMATGFAAGTGLGVLLRSGELAAHLAFLITFCGGIWVSVRKIRRGQLRDFVSRDGDPLLNSNTDRREARRRARRPCVGSRALLALNPDPANPNLFGRKDARNSATFLQIADLGRNLPIALQVRYASLETGTGNPCFLSATSTESLRRPSEIQT